MLTSSERVALPLVVDAPSIAPGRRAIPTSWQESKLRRRTAAAIRGAHHRFETSRGFNRIVLVRVAATQAFHVKTDEMVGPSRMHEVVIPRQIAMTIATKISGKGITEIGHHFGGRDHTCVRCAVAKYGELVAEVLGDMERGLL